MAHLRMCALGRSRVFHNEEALRFPTRRAQDLLCYLLLNAGQTLERGIVAEQLWPDRPPGRARRCLSTTVWRIRETLACSSAPSEPYLLIEWDTLAFNTSAPYSFDVEAFERAAASGLAGALPCSGADCRALEEALKLYRGDLLEGCYDDWCLVERERLRLLHLRVLKRLGNHYRLSGAFDAAISCGHRLLEIDPLQEDVHRGLMHCYTETGQRSLALHQFRSCREAVQRELQVEPMLETWALYRQIRNGKGGTELPESGDSTSELPGVVSQFRHALDTLESAWQALRTLAAESVGPSEPAESKHSHPEQG